MLQPSRLRFADLFAGAGGLSVGFFLANHATIQYQPVLVIDVDPKAVKGYETNVAWLKENAASLISTMPRILKQTVESADIVALLDEVGIEKGSLDLLIGGPPCQGFSPANRQSKKKNRNELNDLVRVFLNKVQDARPKMFLLENVQGVQWTEPTEQMVVVPQQPSYLSEENTNSVPIRVKDFLTNTARAIGYNVWVGILDAAKYGVPQHRMRFFLFGVRSDLMEPLATVDLGKYLTKHEKEEYVTVSEAIEDLPNIDNGEKWEGSDYHPITNDYILGIRKFMQNGELHDHFATKHDEYVIERFSHIPQGGNWSSIRDLMTNYKNIDKTHSNIYRRLISKSPSHTISHYRKAMTIHPTQDRGLSFREACRLQSFPDWFRFNGGTDAIQQQLANAVPPLLASTVAYAIADFWCDLCNALTPTEK